MQPNYIFCEKYALRVVNVMIWYTSTEYVYDVKFDGLVSNIMSFW